MDQIALYNAQGKGVNCRYKHPLTWVIKFLKELPCQSFNSDLLRIRNGENHINILINS